MTILELREKRAKAWEAAKAFLDSHRNDKGVLSGEDDAASSASWRSRRAISLPRSVISCSMRV